MWTPHFCWWNHNCWLNRHFPHGFPMVFQPFHCCPVTLPPLEETIHLAPAAAAWRSGLKGARDKTATKSVPTARSIIYIYIYIHIYIYILCICICICVSIYICIVFYIYSIYNIYSIYSVYNIYSIYRIDGIIKEIWYTISIIYLSYL